MRVGMTADAKNRTRNGATGAAHGTSESGAANLPGRLARRLSHLAHPARLKSLRVQMSLGSALIALGAILLVTLFALFSITRSSDP